MVYRNSRTSPAPTGVGVFGYENEIVKMKKTSINDIGLEYRS